MLRGGGGWGGRGAYVRGRGGDSDTHVTLIQRVILAGAGDESRRLQPTRARDTNPARDTNARDTNPPTNEST